MNPKLTLLTLCALSVSALNVFAQNLIVTSDTTVSGTHYENNGDAYAAITNIDTSWTFTGSDITVTATGGNNTVGAWGVNIYSDYYPILNLTDSTIKANSIGIFFEGGDATLNNVNITAGRDGLHTSYTYNLMMTGGTINSTDGNGAGIFHEYHSSGTLNNVNITAKGFGIYVYSDSSLTVIGSTITAANDGLSIDYNSDATLNNVTVTAENTGIMMYSSSLTMTGGTITAANEGLSLDDYSDATLTNVTVTATGNNGSGVLLQGNSTLTLTDSVIHATGSDAHGISAYSTHYYNPTNTTTLNHSTVTDGISVDARFGEDTNLTLTASNGSLISGGVTVSTPIDDYVVATLDFTLIDSALSGGLTATGSSHVTVTASDGGTITGEVISAQNAVVQITLTNAGTALRGNLIQDNNSAITLTVGADALLAGGGTVSNLIMDTGAILGYTDELTVTTSITIGDNIIIDFSNLTGTGDYTVLDWSGATGGESISDDQFTIAGDGVEGTFNVDNGKLVFNATAVPEPSIWFLIGLGLGALALIRRRI
ncbi:MAG: right-handed parallel beta-helix repeat-containing protein [Verrucomicrobiales bacterium]|nr:right-handed parallel beta-helix repeat-containing protein [Verrucomicrobiales bacterium]